MSIDLYKIKSRLLYVRILVSFLITFIKLCSYALLCKSYKYLLSKSRRFSHQRNVKETSGTSGEVFSPLALETEEKDRKNAVTFKLLSRKAFRILKSTFQLWYFSIWFVRSFYLDKIFMIYLSPPPKKKNTIPNKSARAVPSSGMQIYHFFVQLTSY